MPQISKVRIVNFNYNDGKRLIADELYDFASKEKDDALNVLINLANGGGKSVLVQLMMQPIIPKAKVAGRKIESFFNKASDHCFVLIEWIKDNSTEKLLTGIAMSASESSATEDDSSRGMAVKYYTFYSNYTSYSSPYDILNMSLSKKENGRFVAAEFDDVRTLARKSNGLLNYYVADDNPKWQKKLAEYGLIQSEWRMMEKLNSEEGGLSKFFGDFKTSDHLVDRLLIPTIESKLNQTHSKEDNSLGWHIGTPKEATCFIMLNSDCFVSCCAISETRKRYRMPFSSVTQYFLSLDQPLFIGSFVINFIYQPLYYRRFSSINLATPSISLLSIIRSAMSRTEGMALDTATPSPQFFIGSISSLSSPK